VRCSKLIGLENDFLILKCNFLLKKNNLSPCSNGILSSRHFAWNGFMNFLIEKLEPYLSIHDQQFVLIKINTEPKALGFLPTWNITKYITETRHYTNNSRPVPFHCEVKREKKTKVYLFMFLFSYTFIEINLYFLKIKKNY
jgi:hypothetical protein